MTGGRRPADDDALPPLIGALLRRPTQAVMRRIVADVAAAGYTDIVPAQLAVLRYPGPENRRPSELADDLGTSRQAMNYLLGQLEVNGYLVRVEDPADGRSKVVRLTARGRGLYLRLRDFARQIEIELEEQLGTERLVQLRSLLTELNASPFVSGSLAPGAHSTRDGGRPGR